MCSPGAGRDGVCVLSSAFQQYFLSHSHLQYLWQLNVFPKRLIGRLKYIYRGILLENGLLYPLCHATHILKTVRISRSSKSRHCTTVKSLSFKYSNINVTLPPLLIAYCTHLHSGFAKNNRKKHHYRETHIQTHTRLSLI